MAFKRKRKRNTHYDDPESLFRDRRNRKVQGLLSHQSDILRRYHQEALEKENVALELPTGSGKTLVGLLIAEFRRVTKQERILYLCPTKQLVLQVCEQAERKYGISVTPFIGSQREFSPQIKSSYRTGKTIAVTTYSALFNTNPFFQQPQVIILDDAHASENYIASNWSLFISRYEEESIYFGLLNFFKDSLSPLISDKFSSPIKDTSKWIETVPISKFSLLIPNIIPFLDTNIEDSSNLKYPWSLIRNNLIACNIFISYDSILIRPYIPPSLTHQPFAQATQRIFMSATLGLTGDLERISGIKSFHRLPIPNGWDKQGIGRRYFIFPEESLPEEEIESTIIKMVDRSEKALAIVPNEQGVKKYKEIFKSSNIFTAQDIEKSKDNFISTPNSIAILANRYDGIDLRDDACRLLILEGLPKAGNLQELFFMNRMSAGNLFKDRIRTRIIQAFGRCTRSATDYAAVVIIGQNFYDWLVLEDKRSIFHPELQGELIFGIEQSEHLSQDDFLENLDIFLEHGIDWDDVDEDIREYRNQSEQKDILGQDKLLAAAPEEVNYQYHLWNSDYEKCLSIAQKISGILSGDDLKGLRGLWNYFAASTAELAYGQVGKTSLLELASQQYRRSLSCIPSFTALYELAATCSPQNDEPNLDRDYFLAANIDRIELLFETKQFYTVYKFEAEIEKIFSNLNTEDSTLFEEAHRCVGELLGFESQNSSANGAPDPWWICNDELCLVSEDKSDSKPENAIPIKYARQAASHRDWIKEHVSLNANAQIYTVYITTQSKIHQEVRTYAKDVCWWEIDDFRAWALDAISVMRKLRASFTGSGKMSWREEVRQELIRNQLDPLSIIQRATQVKLKDVPIE